MIIIYNTSSLEQAIETGLGTCIESAIVVKSWFDSNAIENEKKDIIMMKEG